MKKLNVFALARHDGPYETWPKSTELIKDGVSTGKRIPGYVIEAQYEHTNGFLLVTSWDCPFEEAQSFLLLSDELDVICEKTIGAAYAPVWMEGHEPVNDDTVIFHCNGNLDILATLGSAGTVRLKKLQRPKDKM